MLRPEDFFDLEGFAFKAVFQGCDHVWEALPRIGRFVLEYIMTVDAENTIQGKVMTGAYVDDRDTVVIGEGTVVEPGAFIQGPAVIGRNCQIRHGAYIRGHVLVGDGCIVGHASELKNCIMLDTSQCPHFAYVGDSILGRKVGLGAGTRLSNLPIVSTKDEETGKRPPIQVTIAGKTYDTGLPKLGAIIGDGSHLGCNVVTNPGCLIGRNVLVYPNTSLKKGYYPSDRIVKLRQEVTVVKRKPELA